jgi:hypothetical protein
MVGTNPLVGVSVGVSGLVKPGAGAPALGKSNTGEFDRVLAALAVGVASGVVLRFEICDQVAGGGGS